MHVVAVRTVCFYAGGEQWHEDAESLFYHEEGREYHTDAAYDCYAA